MQRCDMMQYGLITAFSRWSICPFCHSTNRSNKSAHQKFCQPTCWSDKKFRWPTCQADKSVLTVADFSISLFMVAD